MRSRLRREFCRCKRTKLEMPVLFGGTRGAKPPDTQIGNVLCCHLELIDRGNNERHRLQEFFRKPLFLQPGSNMFVKSFDDLWSKQIPILVRNDDGIKWKSVWNPRRLSFDSVVNVGIQLNNRFG